MVGKKRTSKTVEAEMTAKSAEIDAAKERDAMLDDRVADFVELPNGTRINRKTFGHEYAVITLLGELDSLKGIDSKLDLAIAIAYLLGMDGKTARNSIKRLCRKNEIAAKSMAWAEKSGESLLSFVAVMPELVGDIVDLDGDAGGA